MSLPTENKEVELEPVTNEQILAAIGVLSADLDALIEKVTPFIELANNLPPIPPAMAGLFAKGLAPRR